MYIKFYCNFVLFLSLCFRNLLEKINQHVVKFDISIADTTIVVAVAHLDYTWYAYNQSDTSEGKIVLLSEFQGENSVAVDISDLTKGFYLMTVTVDGKIVKKKIVVE